jgi:hypothetical protein
MRSDGRTSVMSELIVAFRNSATAPKMCYNQQRTTQTLAPPQNLVGLMRLSVIVIQSRLSELLLNFIIDPDCT